MFIISKEFLDKYFKFLFLFFWPIVWYDYVSIAAMKIEIFMFLLFLTASIVYIIMILKSINKIKDIDVLYRITTILAFILFLCSYLLFSKNIILLILKLISLFIYFYVSCIKNFKYNENEGVVGMLSSLLLVTITFSY